MELKYNLYHYFVRIFENQFYKPKADCDFLKIYFLFDPNDSNGYQAREINEIKDQILNWSAQFNKHPNSGLIAEKGFP